MSDKERKSVAEMIAEGLREIGVLILVFGVLDKLLKAELTGVWLGGVLVSGCYVFSLGMYLERRREE